MESVSKTYSGKNVFITGVTGFLGSVLLEKLLRSCPDIDRVYVLIRKRRGHEVQERLKKMLSSPVFTDLSENALSKVIPVEGDMSVAKLGISPEVEKLLIEKVHFVFHVAASINFSSPLTNAIRTNLNGTRSVLNLSKVMPNIQAFVYVSTAYCNCTQRDVIAEEVYPNRWKPNEIITLMESCTEDEMARLTPNILGGHPNTYSFTKLLSENLLKEERGHVPVAIVRPSVVLGTMKDPFPGWLDNVFSGAFGFIAGAGRGVFRTIPCRGECQTNMVPCDLLASLLVSSAWSVSKSRELEVYHFTSTEGNTLTWSEYCSLVVQKLREFPCQWLVFYPRVKCRTPGLRSKLFVLYAHYIPAVILDIVSMIRRVKPLLKDIQFKYTRGMLHCDYFTNHQWSFSTSNTRQLFESLSEKDKEEFNFDNRNIDWPKYIECCVLGVRKFFHHQKDSRIPLARKHLKIWRIVDAFSIAMIFLLIAYFLSGVFQSSAIACGIAFILTLLYIWF